MNVERQLRTAAVEVLASRPAEFAHLFGSHAQVRRAMTETSMSPYTCPPRSPPGRPAVSLEIAGELGHPRR